MRALLVGINKYPGSPLRGCVNDILATREILMNRFGLTSNDIHVLIDERATKKNIIARLEWLLKEQFVNKRLLFWYSGHGAYLPNRDQKNDFEYTGNDQLICPVDFDWISDRYILDDEFYGMIKARKHPSSQLTSVMDCCHSGTFYRDIQPSFFAPANYRQEKSISPPLDMVLRDNEYREGRAYWPALKPRKPDIKGFKMLSGCKDTQTSADAYIKGKYCGALSHCLQALWSNGDMELDALVKETCASLARNSFEQEPQLSVGPGADMSRLI